MHVGFFVDYHRFGCGSPLVHRDRSAARLKIFEPSIERGGVWTFPPDEGAPVQPPVKVVFGFQGSTLYAAPPNPGVSATRKVAFQLPRRFVPAPFDSTSISQWQPQLAFRRFGLSAPCRGLRC